MTASKLEKILATVSGAIPLVEGLFYRNSAPQTPAARLLGNKDPLIYNSDITPHLGDFPESFVIPAASGLVGDLISDLGDRKKSKFLQILGQYLPEISTGAIVAYGTLGESVLPQIMPGTADPKDIPAVLISALAGYFLARFSRKSGFNSKIKEYLGKFNAGRNYSPSK